MRIVSYSDGGIQSENVIGIHIIQSEKVIVMHIIRLENVILEFLGRDPVRFAAVGLIGFAPTCSAPVTYCNKWYTVYSVYFVVKTPRQICRGWPELKQGT